MEFVINKNEEYDNYYIIDFLNIFSDYREIIYKKKNIDFHSVKHNNKENDTYNFFRLFFTKYIEKVNIEKCSVFIFIMKKINNYDDILNNILNSYNDFKIKFILIEDEYNNKTIDKNKDDFLCQYIFFFLFKNYKKYLACIIQFKLMQLQVIILIFNCYFPNFLLIMFFSLIIILINGGFQRRRMLQSL